MKTKSCSNPKSFINSSQVDPTSTSTIFLRFGLDILLVTSVSGGNSFSQVLGSGIESPMQIKDIGCTGLSGSLVEIFPSLYRSS
mmetsp:Transcript_2042/g.5345  ORF Transcript_2042/g.5345 Transcript_2042/m.5345 type:complete len:84 (-) Transcript_2042:189-440(-)